MYREQLQRLLSRLMLALRMKRRFTLSECYQLLQLAEAIIEHGRMIQAYHGHPAPEAVVEIPELARRFRETPKTIKNALLLLREMGRAEPVPSHGYWKLRLADPLLSGRKMPWQDYKELCIDMDGKRETH